VGRSLQAECKRGRVLSNQIDRLAPIILLHCAGKILDVRLAFAAEVDDLSAREKSLVGDHARRGRALDELRIANLVCLGSANRSDYVG
jgi:hypothetical protein